MIKYICILYMLYIFLSLCIIIALPWRVCLGCPACISLVSPLLYLTVSLVSRVSHVSIRYLSILQQIHCIPLYPTVSSCIRTYLAVSSCIPLYISHGIRISPPRKRDIAKNTLQGRAYNISITKTEHRDRDRG